MIKIYEPDGMTLRALAQSVSEARMETEILPEAIIDAADLLAALKAEAAAAVIAQAEAYGDRLTAGYPLHEILSWPVKVGEAKAILAGETDATMYPVIAAECQFTKAVAHDVALAVLAKAKPFAMASGAISGLRQEAIRRIGIASDEPGVTAALAWAKKAAEAAFEGLSKGL